MSTILEILSNQVEQELPKVVTEAFRGLDSVYSYIDTTSMDVMQANSANMGYKWQIEHLFEGGVAGRLQSSNPLGMDVFDNSNYSNSGLNIPNTSDGEATPFPSYSNVPHAGVIKRTLQLHMNTGNISFPVQWMQHDKLSAANIKQVAMDVKALGKNRARMEAISFFNDVVSDGSNNYPILGQVASVGASSSPTVNNLVIGIQKGRINYFRPGMMVSIYSASDATTIDTPSASTRRNDIDAQTNTEVYLFVNSVDFLGNTITVTGVSADDGSAVDVSPSGDLDEDVATDDFIVWRQSSTGPTGDRPLVSWGLNDWIKSSGKLFAASGTYSFDLAKYPHFASKVVDNGSSPLDETTLTKTVGSFIDAYGENAPDSILTTWGVTLKYLQGPAAGSFTERANYERNGKAMNVKGGFDDVGYKFNGRNMRWLISSLCLPETLYALNLQGGNIKRYVPPKLDGSGDSRVGNEVEFLNKAVNGGNIFKIAHSGSGTSMNMVEAPFWQYRLIAPIDVKACKITNITEIS